MKFEYELDEKLLQATVAEKLNDFFIEKIRAEIASQVNGWMGRNLCTEAVRDAAHLQLKQLVSEKMQNLPALEAMVNDEILRKIKNNVAAQMKAGKQ